jgi:acyl carrier protein
MGASGIIKSRDEIVADVIEVLQEALGVDAEEVTLDATLNGDLGAESIDYLDIVFRLEKKFSTPERPFKIAQGEMLPENLMSDPSLVEGGKVTAKGIALLKERMPHLELGAWQSNPTVSTLGELFTVRSLVEFVDRKLKS